MNKCSKGSLNTALLIGLLIINLVGFGYLATQKNAEVNVEKAVTKAIETNEARKVGGEENYKMIQKLYASAEFKANQKNGISQALAQVEQAKREKMPKVLAKNELASITKNIIVEGNKDTPLLLLEYSDIECPVCKDYHASKTVSKILDAHKNDVKMSIRHFPLSFHKNAQHSAEAIECVKDQTDAKNVYKYIEALFATKDISVDGVLKVAKDNGLDDAKIKKCLDNKDKKAVVKAQFEEGRKLFNINGTPTLILINTKTGDYKKVVRSYNGIEEGIKELLKK